MKLLIISIVFLLFTYNINAQIYKEMPRWYFERVFNTDEPGYLLPFERDILLRSENSVEFLLEKIEATNEYEKRKAIGLLGDLRNKGFLDLFKTNLKSKDPLTVSRALHAIAEFNDDEATKIIGSVLTSTPKYNKYNYVVIIGILRLLHEQTLSSSIPYLEKFIKEHQPRNDQERYYSKLAIEVLEDIKTYHKSIDSRNKLLNDKLANLNKRQSDFLWAIDKIRDSSDTSLLSLVRTSLQEHFYSEKSISNKEEAYQALMRLRNKLGDTFTLKEMEYLNSNNILKKIWTEKEVEDFIAKIMAWDEKIKHEKVP